MNKILCFLLLPLQLLALDLKEEVKKAEKGDFIVYAYKQSVVLCLIRENTPPMLVVEEISAPLDQTQTNWQEWISKQAPGHTSWTISRINITDGNIASIFSVDARSFLNSNPAFQFLPTLISLQLHRIEPYDRKYIGAAPLAGEQDLRSLWLPKIIFQGKQIFPLINAYRVRWPKDESELSGKPIDIYLVASDTSGGALTYLPYWIEVLSVAKAKISALDSGKNLSSPIQFETYEQIQN